MLLGTRINMTALSFELNAQTLTSGTSGGFILLRHLFIIFSSRPSSNVMPGIAFGIFVFLSASTPIKIMPPNVFPSAHIDLSNLIPSGKLALYSIFGPSGIF